MPEYVGGGNVFFGAAKSENGELIAMDGDSYSKDTIVIDYEEWSDESGGIENGLTVLLEGLLAK